MNLLSLPRVYFGLENNQIIAAYVKNRNWNYIREQFSSEPESSFLEAYGSVVSRVCSKVKIFIRQDLHGEEITPLSEVPAMKIRKSMLEEEDRKSRGRRTIFDSTA